MLNWGLRGTLNDRLQIEVFTLLLVKRKIMGKILMHLNVVQISSFFTDTDVCCIQ